MTLANDFGDLRPRYDFVVVGSGYGAAICAARVAQRASVCVLERGREWVAGDFPSAHDELLRESQFSDVLGHQGNPLGLFDFHLNRDVDVLVGCGLGGTSLINGGVSIEPDPRVLAQACWPDEIRLQGLASHFERARGVLRPTPYPEGHATPAKLAAMERASRAKGASFSRLPVNVHFGVRGPNPSGVHQEPCTDCGDCVTGCNFHAKNTLPYTYLPLAKRAGAHLFTRCDVRSIEKLDRYRVRFDRIDADGVRHEEHVDARAVILGAGVLGSTGILLRSRTPSFDFSDRLGSGFSTNGDALTIGYNCEVRTDSIGWGKESVVRPTGPTLLGAADFRDDQPLEASVVIEDGAFPSGLSRLLAPVVQLLASCAEETSSGVVHWLRERQREALDLAGSTRTGALNHSMLYLSMGHDGACGQLSLDDRGRVVVSWPGLRDAPCFPLADEAAKKLTEALGGMHLRNPFFANAIARHLFTVHPLGGCIMGSHVDSGVVDHAGRVFDPTTGRAHEGLYVADGSIVPTSLGINPLLTISALAERVADHVLMDCGITNPDAS